ncbi:hypothetical protein Plec18167_008524 [Paecilomyces lecythidis]|uniref:Uncharacterized protein n=1 Tax=Paecilomyces lecythidis TaxID=3004212 RepID=A0ABR3WW97_9EURO
MHLPIPPPPTPNPAFGASLETPFSSEPLDQIRTGKIKQLYNLPLTSAIYKYPLSQPTRVNFLGLEGDEHAFHKHGGPDKALLHYCSRHYDVWKTEQPQSAHRFTIGAFGENLVSKVANERNVCIGDIFLIGTDVLVQVTMPRQPCYKLNHRFEVKDMSRLSQEFSRTGWYYRVLQEGAISAGDRISLVERRHERWTVANVQHYLHRETRNFAAMEEIVKIEELGEEVKKIFQNRLKKNFEDQNQRLVGDETLALKTWSEYRVVRKQREANRVVSLILEAVHPVGSDDDIRVEPGSHVRLKLGGNMMRAYSVVSGAQNRFEIGVALEPNSRGGSKYLHESLKEGDILSASQIVSSFPLSREADHHVLIAGGIGITAFLAAAEQMQENGESYTLHLAVRSEDDIPFSSRLARLGRNVITYPKSIGKRLIVAQILARTNDNTHIYCCGPSRLMDAVSSEAIKYGISPDHIHFEAFEIATSGDPFTAEIATTKKTIQVDECQTLLDALRESGLEIPSSCEAGSCGTCRVGYLKGRIDHRGTGLLESEKDFALLSCASRGVGHVVLDL